MKAMEYVLMRYTYQIMVDILLQKYTDAEG